MELVEAGHPIKTIILEKPPGKIGYVLITEGAPGTAARATTVDEIIAVHMIPTLSQMSIQGSYDANREPGKRFLLC